MEYLKKIYIQDPFADDIKENVQAILLDSGKEVTIITKRIRSSSSFLMNYKLNIDISFIVSE